VNGIWRKAVKDVEIKGSLVYKEEVAVCIWS
jgi:hypothetical protein